MSDPPASELANEVRESTLNYLWRQWRVVGATVTSDQPARIIVDPEALILMSLWMAPHERRLADVVWSWTTVNSALLSIQRLGNLRDDFPPIVGRRLAALAETRVAGAKDIRWKSLRRKDVEPMGERDGKLRAIPPRLTSWATLMLQLRLGMGVGAKADVLTFVLGLSAQGSEWANVAMIADGIGYTPAAVRRVADDLAAARFIRVLDTAESDQPAQRMFSGGAGAWATLLGTGINTPGWGYWRERYRFVTDLLSMLEAEESRPTSGYAQDVAARELLTRHGSALRKDRIVDPVEFAGAELNRSYLVRAARALTTWWTNQG